MPISKAEWKTFREQLANIKSGWNPLFDLGPALKEFFPGFEIAFISEDDFPEATTYGWKPLRPEHFPGGVDEYNSTVAMRYGLSERDGAVWFRDSMLCIMPSDLRQAVMKARSEASEKRFRGNLREDPEKVVGRKMVDTSYKQQKTTIGELAAEGAKTKGRQRKRP